MSGSVMDINPFFSFPACSSPEPQRVQPLLSEIFLPSVVRPFTKRPFSSVAPYSRYGIPIDTSPGRAAGYSRNYGDASSDVQMTVMKKILDASAEFAAYDRALLLSIARLESGFNPDAASPATSAAGVFQFIKSTGRAYGLDDERVFDLDANISAGIKIFGESSKLIQKKYPNVDGSERAVLLYALHHDGPSLAYGGELIARKEIVPYLEGFRALVDRYTAEQQ